MCDNVSVCVCVSDCKVFKWKIVKGRNLCCGYVCVQGSNRLPDYTERKGEVPSGRLSKTYDADMFRTWLIRVLFLFCLFQFWLVSMGEMCYALEEHSHYYWVQRNCDLFSSFSSNGWVCDWSKAFRRKGWDSSLLVVTSFDTKSLPTYPESTIGYKL